MKQEFTKQAKMNEDLETAIFKMKDFRKQYLEQKALDMAEAKKNGRHVSLEEMKAIKEENELSDFGESQIDDDLDAVITEFDQLQTKIQEQFHTFEKFEGSFNSFIKEEN